MTDIEEFRRYMDDSFDFHGLPVDNSIEVVPGVAENSVECRYRNLAMGLNYTFCIDFILGESFDHDINIFERKRGYGTRMVKAMESFSRRVGVKVVTLGGIVDGAEGFWKKMGYTDGVKILDLY